MKEEMVSNNNAASETIDSVDVYIDDDLELKNDLKSASPPPTALPNTISRLRVDTPAKRSTSNKENVEPDAMASPQPTTPLNYDHLDHTAASAATPPSPSRSRSPTSKAEDPIVALDQLDDAVENINKDIPDVQTSPEKPKNVESKSPVLKKKEKAPPVVRTTKAAAARISMAHNKEQTSSKTSSLGRPRQSMALGRASSVRESSVNKTVPDGKRVTSNSSTKEEKAQEGEGGRKEVVIPHSKRRPISMSFPMPPPPPKSTKAPTQSTFQLSGDAVATKLKAQREARQQKESQEAEKKTFKARPVPSSLSKAPSVRQTNASRARESIMNGKDLRASTLGVSGPAHGRANSVATTRPSAPHPRTVSREPSSRLTTSTRPAPSTSTRPRPSTSLANISKPRTSLSTSTGTRVASTSSSKGTSTTKGKEVFNRAAVAKANAEKEKQEREAVAKKARADAAERSRQLSREFAEKQKAKKARAAAAQPVTAETTTTVEA